MAKQDLAFEHKVIQPLKSEGGGIWLLAVSGGVDSMVMAECLYRWSRLLKIQLRVAHVHHGNLTDQIQKRYRLRAQKAVAAWSKKRAIPFFTNSPEDVELNSEADLRDYRQKFLKAWRAEAGADFVVLAHHADDLLETRMLRLIRGTGAYGLRGMRRKQAGKLRPLLECSRTEIENYARLRGVKFCTDPSNRKLNSLRNWLRKDWLPRLEKRRPGALMTMARSLELLSEKPTEILGVEPTANAGLRREIIRKAPVPERERLVADYLRNFGLKNYSRNHVREILKRIDSPQKNPTFRMLGVVFQVTPDLFWASRV